MFTIFETHPVLLVLFVLLAALLMPTIFHFRRQLCGAVALTVMFIALLVSINFIRLTLEGEVLSYAVGGWSAPWGIEVLIEPLSAFMLAVISFIALIVIFYSVFALEWEVPEAGIGWYYTTLLLLVASMKGMAITNDLFKICMFLLRWWAFRLVP